MNNKRVLQRLVLCAVVFSVCSTMADGPKSVSFAERFKLGWQKLVAPRKLNNDPAGSRSGAPARATFGRKTASGDVLRAVATGRSSKSAPYVRVAPRRPAPQRTRKL